MTDKNQQEVSIKKAMIENIAKGEWYVSDIPQEDGEYIYTKHNLFSAIVRVYKKESNKQQAEATAELIAEAGNVTNETGKSPREILNERNELLEALKGMVKAFEGYAEAAQYKSGLFMAKEAIKKATE